MIVSLLFAISGVAWAQQVYIPTTGPAARPSCTTTSASILTTTGCQPSPSYYFSQFSYTQTETVRTATSVTPAPGPSSSYGLPFASVSHLLPAISTTSWGNWVPDAVVTATDTANPYGQAAYSALWKNANLPNVTHGLYSTTVSPTPVPTTELILPPPLYFGPSDCYVFPRDFMLGVSGAAAQVEGAVADEGRSPAVPDFLAQFAQALSSEAPGASVSGYDDDFTAAENYYLYKQDIERLAAIGVKYHSFNIAWSRILPFAVPGSPVNEQGLKHYDDLINFTIEKGMQPVVTLTHFDTPAQFIGGNWTGLAVRSYFGELNLGYQNETFEDAFVNYGKIVMMHFSDRVPIWITFNEPQTGCESGPSVDHVIKSHAQLYHFYKEELQGKGMVSLKMGTAPGIAQLPLNASHVAAAQHYNDLNIGAFLNPLALGKDYPEAYKMTIQDYVPLTEEDLTYLNGTLDFIGVDMYSAASIYPAGDIAICAANNDSSNALYPNCVGATEETTTGWNMGYHDEYTTYTTPTYLRTQLNYLWNTYKTPLTITEFGFSISSSHLSTELADIRFDIQRSEYYLSYLTEVLKSIWEDHVNIMGAFMWSWVDNWEWGTFSHTFGVQYLNRTSQERVYKRSFFDVIDFVETRRMECGS